MSAVLRPASAAPMRERVDALQVEVSKFPQYEPPTRHHFHGGMYCREMWCPAGTLVIGRVHKCEHFFLIASGVVWITTDNGEAERFEAPYMIVSSPGIKRAVYSETETLYMTIHRTESDTVEDAEAELVEADPMALLGVGNKLKTEVLT